MFYGEHEHTIDKKGRIIIPSRFREFFKEYDIKRCYITRGLDKCLFLFTEDEWKAQESKFKAMPFTKQEIRKFNRIYFSGAIDIIPDRQGRFIIPQFLKDFAFIKKDVVIIGVSNRIEIWAGNVWKEFYATSRDSFEEIAERLIES